MIKIDNRLNNIFDQYDQEENRVTNAFLQTLAKNEALLREFLTKYFGIEIGKNANIVISSQKEPFGLGDEEQDRERAEGIPDGWIIINEEQAIVFETKIVRNAIRQKQLFAHIKRIKGYNQKYLCIITPDERSPAVNICVPNVRIEWIPWRDIYKLISKENEDQSSSGYLANQLKEYLAMKEDIVGFQGIDYPSGSFNAREAKIIIKSLIREIRQDIINLYRDLRFERKVFTQDINPYTVYHRSVWSFLGADENFTKDMHLTFWLTETHMGMGITVPNNAGKRWKRLKEIFADDKLFKIFMEKLYKSRTSLPNLYLEFVHRHYIRQRDGVIDGIMEMDIDTIKGSPKIKANKKWLEAMRDLIKNKQGYNGQLMIRTRFFYKDHPDIRTAAFKDKVVKTAYVLRDVFNYLREWSS